VFCAPENESDQRSAISWRASCKPDSITASFVCAQRQFEQPAPSCESTECAQSLQISKLAMSTSDRLPGSAMPCGGSHLERRKRSFPAIIRVQASPRRNILRHT
jgi:hypothetical protein